MMQNTRNLAEWQILKAQSEDQLERLQGEGKPLPDHSGEPLGDPALGAITKSAKLEMRHNIARDARRSVMQ